MDAGHKHSSVARPSPKSDLIYAHLPTLGCEKREIFLGYRLELPSLNNNKINVENVLKRYEEKVLKNMLNLRHNIYQVNETQENARCLLMWKQDPTVWT